MTLHTLLKYRCFRRIFLLVRVFGLGCCGNSIEVSGFNCKLLQPWPLLSFDADTCTPCSLRFLNRFPRDANAIAIRFVPILARRGLLSFFDLGIVLFYKKRIESFKKRLLDYIKLNVIESRVVTILFCTSNYFVESKDERFFIFFLFIVSFENMSQPIIMDIYTVELNTSTRFA